jgi:uncharacterized protein YdiU (UPF0061 family)
MSETVTSIRELAERIEYSLLDALNPDPQALEHGGADGADHSPRQVFSGHYVPVAPTPLPDAQYIAHSQGLFNELGWDDTLALDDNFKLIFSGDLSTVPSPMRSLGWATGYALSIFGTEYQQQCPFGTGNGYGDGRALSIFEYNSPSQQHWEFQLKGAGRTPYCRGGDGRAVLRSSIREFLAQEHMHALGVPTSRSLCLFTSLTETVHRPWYESGSTNFEPDTTVANPVAISTRVAPSFLRIGQVELFARRARGGNNPEALTELQMLVEHVIAREYAQEIDRASPFNQQVLALASAYRTRLIHMVTQWIRVGFCQGNFNSDNCALGGFTLDYGPFGFVDCFAPYYQPWTGGGEHFAFLNQPLAAHKNFVTLCQALAPLLALNEAKTQATKDKDIQALQDICNDFGDAMQASLDTMWAQKLGLSTIETDFGIALLTVMSQSQVDYTLLFRLLSDLPDDFTALTDAFYAPPSDKAMSAWQAWFAQWRGLIDSRTSTDTSAATITEQMQAINPLHIWREYQVVPAYEAAAQGDYARVHELHQLLRSPYEVLRDGTDEASKLATQNVGKTPDEFRFKGGVSHYSCSS